MSEKEYNTVLNDASEEAVDIEENTVPEELAILPLRGVVVYPLTFQALNVGQPRSIQLVDDATLSKQPIGLVVSRDADLEEPGPEDVYEIGVAAAIHRMIKARLEEQKQT